MLVLFGDVLAGPGQLGSGGCQEEHQAETTSRGTFVRWAEKDICMKENENQRSRNEPPRVDSKGLEGSDPVTIGMPGWMLHGEE